MFEAVKTPEAACAEQSAGKARAEREGASEQSRKGPLRLIAEKVSYAQGKKGKTCTRRILLNPAESFGILGGDDTPVFCELSKGNGVWDTFFLAL